MLKEPDIQPSGNFGVEETAALAPSQGVVVRPSDEYEDKLVTRVGNLVRAPRPKSYLFGLKVMLHGGGFAWIYKEEVGPNHEYIFNKRFIFEETTNESVLSEKNPPLCGTLVFC